MQGSFNFSNIIQSIVEGSHNTLSHKRDIERTSVQIDAIMKTDSVSQITSWLPLNEGGTRNNTSRRLIIDNNTASLNTSLISILFTSIISCLVFAGVIYFVSLMVPEIIKQTQMSSASWQVAGMYGIAALIIISIAYAVIKQYINNSIIPIKFNKKTKCFQKGFSKKLNNTNPRQQDVIKSGFFDNISLNMDNIYALQIISETISETTGNSNDNHRRTRYFKSYELNVVLKDGSRVNILDHGKIERLTEDAQKLSQFLGKPLWSAA